MKFKVGEIAMHVGKGDWAAGELVEITAVGPFTRDPESGRGFASGGLPVGSMDYLIKSLSDGYHGCAREMFLRKLPGKHQPDDLKAADPQFINHQLPRWLKQEEKVDACKTT
jgi:hypothetical protein